MICYIFVPWSFYFTDAKDAVNLRTPRVKNKLTCAPEQKGDLIYIIKGLELKRNELINEILHETVKTSFTIESIAMI